MRRIKNNNNPQFEKQAPVTSLLHILRNDLTVSRPREGMAFPSALFLNSPLLSPVWILKRSPCLGLDCCAPPSDGAGASGKQVSTVQVSAVLTAESMKRVS